MRVLITSGGSREPIDDVRYLGNSASGRTGAWLSEELVRRFHTVHLLSGVASILPETWANETGLLSAETYGSASDLLARCQELTKRYTFDAILFAAAVADFSPVPVKGKLSSKAEELVLHLRPTPKVVDAVARWSPDAILVTFKLESVDTRVQLVERALASMARVGSDWVVANFAAGMGTTQHGAFIVYPSGESSEVSGRKELVETLVDLLEQENERRRGSK